MSLPASWMTELQLDGANPLSPLLTIVDDAVYQEAASSFYANGMDGTHIRLYRHGPLLPKSAIPMIVFASLAAVVVLLLKCVSASRRGRAANVAKRGLSDSEDSSPLGSGVVCGLEEGSVDSSSPEKPGSGTEHEEETGEPCSKRQRLDSGPTDGAMGVTLRNPVEVDAAEALLLLLEQSPGPSPSGPRITPSQHSTENDGQILAGPVSLLESQSLLSRRLSQSREFSADLQPILVAPAGDFFYGGDSAGSPREVHHEKIVEFSPAERPQDSQQPQQPTPPPSALEQTAAGGPSGASASPSSPQPSTSSGLPSQRLVSPQARRVHAFARLPKVQPMESKVVFNPDFLGLDKFGVCGITQICANIRQQLAREELDQVAIVNLVRNVEKLVAHCMKYETFGFTRRNIGEELKVLGRRFLIFDLVVSVFNLIGAPPNGKWWENLIAAVPHDPPKRLPLKGPKNEFNRELMEELSSAMAILKTGVRPSTEKLVKVKRMLFCSEFSPPHFKAPAWDPWRKDDEDAKSNNDVED